MTEGRMKEEGVRFLGKVGVLGNEGVVGASDEFSTLETFAVADFDDRHPLRDRALELDTVLLELSINQNELRLIENWKYYPIKRQGKGTEEHDRPRRRTPS